MGLLKIAILFSATYSFLLQSTKMLFFLYGWTIELIIELTENPSYRLNAFILT